MVREIQAVLHVPQVAVLSTVKCFVAVYVASVDVHVVGDSFLQDGTQVDEIIKYKL